MAQNDEQNKQMTLQELVSKTARETQQNLSETGGEDPKVAEVKARATNLVSPLFADSKKEIALREQLAQIAKLQTLQSIGQTQANNAVDTLQALQNSQRNKFNTLINPKLDSYSMNSKLDEINSNTDFKVMKNQVSDFYANQRDAISAMKAEADYAYKMNGIKQAKDKLEALEQQSIQRTAEQLIINDLQATVAAGHTMASSIYDKSLNHKIVDNSAAALFKSGLATTASETLDFINAGLVNTGAALTTTGRIGANMLGLMSDEELDKQRKSTAEWRQKELNTGIATTAKDLLRYRGSLNAGTTYSQESLQEKLLREQHRKENDLGILGSSQTWGDIGNNTVEMLAQSSPEMAMMLLLGGAGGLGKGAARKTLSQLNASRNTAEALSVNARAATKEYRAIKNSAELKAALKGESAEVTAASNAAAKAERRAAVATQRAERASNTASNRENALRANQAKAQEKLAAAKAAEQEAKDRAIASGTIIRNNAEGKAKSAIQASKEARVAYKDTLKATATKYGLAETATETAIFKAASKAASHSLTKTGTALGGFALGKQVNEGRDAKNGYNYTPTDAVTNAKQYTAALGYTLLNLLEANVLLKSPAKYALASVGLTKTGIQKVGEKLFRDVNPTSRIGQAIVGRFKNDTTLAAAQQTARQLRELSNALKKPNVNIADIAKALSVPVEQVANSGIKKILANASKMAKGSLTVQAGKAALGRGTLVGGVAVLAGTVEGMVEIIQTATEEYMHNPKVFKDLPDAYDQIADVIGMFLRNKIGSELPEAFKYDDVTEKQLAQLNETQKHMLIAGYEGFNGSLVLGSAGVGVKAVVDTARDFKETEIGQKISNYKVRGSNNNPDPNPQIQRQGGVDDIDDTQSFLDNLNDEEDISYRDSFRTNESTGNAVIDTALQRVDPNENVDNLTPRQQDIRRAVIQQRDAAIEQLGSNLVNMLDQGIINAPEGSAEAKDFFDNYMAYMAARSQRQQEGMDNNFNTADIISNLGRYDASKDPTDLQALKDAIINGNRPSLQSDTTYQSPIDNSRHNTTRANVANYRQAAKLPRLIDGAKYLANKLEKVDPNKYKNQISLLNNIANTLEQTIDVGAAERLLYQSHQDRQRNQQNIEAKNNAEEIQLAKLFAGTSYKGVGNLDSFMDYLNAFMSSMLALNSNPDAIATDENAATIQTKLKKEIENYKNKEKLYKAIIDHLDSLGISEGQDITKTQAWQTAVDNRPSDMIYAYLDKKGKLQFTTNETDAGGQPTVVFNKGDDNSTLKQRRDGMEKTLDEKLLLERSIFSTLSKLLTEFGVNEQKALEVPTEIETQVASITTNLYQYLADKIKAMEFYVNKLLKGFSQTISQADVTLVFDFNRDSSNANVNDIINYYRDHSNGKPVYVGVRDYDIAQALQGVSNVGLIPVSFINPGMTLSDRQIQAYYDAIEANLESGATITIPAGIYNLTADTAFFNFLKKLSSNGHTIATSDGVVVDIGNQENSQQRDFNDTLTKAERDSRNSEGTLSYNETHMDNREKKGTDTDTNAKQGILRTIFKAFPKKVLNKLHLLSTGIVQSIQANTVKSFTDILDIVSKHNVNNSLNIHSLLNNMLLAVQKANIVEYVNTEDNKSQYASRSLYGAVEVNGEVIPNFNLSRLFVEDNEATLKGLLAVLEVTASMNPDTALESDKDNTRVTGADGNTKATKEQLEKLKSQARATLAVKVGQTFIDLMGYTIHNHFMVDGQGNRSTLDMEAVYRHFGLTLLEMFNTATENQVLTESTNDNLGVVLSLNIEGFKNLVYNPGSVTATELESLGKALQEIKREVINKPKKENFVAYTNDTANSLYDRAIREFKNLTKSSVRLLRDLPSHIKRQIYDRLHNPYTFAYSRESLKVLVSQLHNNKDTFKRIDGYTSNSEIQALLNSNSISYEEAENRRKLNKQIDEYYDNVVNQLDKLANNDSMFNNGFIIEADIARNLREVLKKANKDNPINIQSSHLFRFIMTTVRNKQRAIDKKVTREQLDNDNLSFFRWVFIEELGFKLANDFKFTNDNAIDDFIYSVEELLDNPNDVNNKVKGKGTFVFKYNGEDNIVDSANFGKLLSIYYYLLELKHRKNNDPILNMLELPLSSELDGTTQGVILKYLKATLSEKDFDKLLQGGISFDNKKKAKLDIYEAFVQELSKKFSSLPPEALADPINNYYYQKLKPLIESVDNPQLFAGRVEAIGPKIFRSIAKIYVQRQGYGAASGTIALSDLLEDQLHPDVYMKDLKDFEDGTIVNKNSNRANLAEREVYELDVQIARLKLLHEITLGKNRFNINDSSTVAQIRNARDRGLSKINLKSVPEFVDKMKTMLNRPLGFNAVINATFKEEFGSLLIYNKTIAVQLEYVFNELKGPLLKAIDDIIKNNSKTNIDEKTAIISQLIDNLGLNLKIYFGDEEITISNKDTDEILGSVTYSSFNGSTQKNNSQVEVPNNDSRMTSDNVLGIQILDSILMEALENQFSYYTSIFDAVVVSLGSVDDGMYAGVLHNKGLYELLVKMDLTPNADLLISTRLLNMITRNEEGYPLIFDAIKLIPAFMNQLLKIFGVSYNNMSNKAVGNRTAFTSSTGSTIDLETIKEIFPSLEKIPATNSKYANLEQELLANPRPNINDKALYSAQILKSVLEAIEALSNRGYVNEASTIQDYLFNHLMINDTHIPSVTHRAIAMKALLSRNTNEAAINTTNVSNQIVATIQNDKDIESDLNILKIDKNDFLTTYMDDPIRLLATLALIRDKVKFFGINNVEELDEAIEKYVDSFNDHIHFLSDKVTDVLTNRYLNKDGAVQPDRNYLVAVVQGFVQHSVLQALFNESNITFDLNDRSAIRDYIINAQDIVLNKLHNGSFVDSSTLQDIITTYNMVVASMSFSYLDARNALKPEYQGGFLQLSNGMPYIADRAFTLSNSTQTSSINMDENNLKDYNTSQLKKQQEIGSDIVLDLSNYDGTTNLWDALNESAGKVLPSISVTTVVQGGMPLATLLNNIRDTSNIRVILPNNNNLAMNLTDNQFDSGVNIEQAYLNRYKSLIKKTYVNTNLDYMLNELAKLKDQVNNSRDIQDIFTFMHADVLVSDSNPNTNASRLTPGIQTIVGEVLGQMFPSATFIPHSNPQTSSSDVQSLPNEKLPDVNTQELYNEFFNPTRTDTISVISSSDYAKLDKNKSKNYIKIEANGSLSFSRDVRGVFIQNTNERAIDVLESTIKGFIRDLDNGISNPMYDTFKNDILNGQDSPLLNIFRTLTESDNMRTILGGNTPTYIIVESSGHNNQLELASLLQTAFSRVYSGTKPISNTIFSSPSYNTPEQSSNVSFEQKVQGIAEIEDTFEAQLQADLEEGLITPEEARELKKQFNAMVRYGDKSLAEVLFTIKHHERTGEHTGTYESTNHEVVLNLFRSSSNSTSRSATMLHELVHATTLFAIKNDRAAATKLFEAVERIFRTGQLTVDRLATYFKGDRGLAESFYNHFMSGLNSSNIEDRQRAIAEFVAIASSDPRVRALLKDIELGSVAKSNSIINKLYDFVKTAITSMYNLALRKPLNASSTNALSMVDGLVNELYRSSQAAKYPTTLNKAMKEVGEQISKANDFVVEGILKPLIDKYASSPYGGKSKISHERLVNEYVLFLNDFTKAMNSDNKVLATSKVMMKYHRLMLLSRWNEDIATNMRVHISRLMGVNSAAKAIFDSFFNTRNTKTDFNVQVLINHSNNLDRVRNNNEKIATKYLDDLLPNSTQEDKKDLSRVLLDTDILGMVDKLRDYRVISSNNLVDLGTILRDDRALNLAIENMNGRLEAFLHTDNNFSTIENVLAKYRRNFKANNYLNYIHNATDNLANYMVNGKALYPGLKMNAEQIARMYGSQYVLTDNYPIEIRDLVDIITTLKALKLVDSNTRNKVYSTIVNNRNSMQDVAIMFNNITEHARDNLFGNSPSLMVKGYSPRLYDNTKEIRIVPASAKAVYEQQGYKYVEYLTNPLTGHMVMMVRDSGSEVNTLTRTAMRYSNTRAKGNTLSDIMRNSISHGMHFDQALHNRKRAVSTLNTQLNNSTIASFNGTLEERVADDFMVPVYNSQGEITDYRYVLSRYTAENVLGENTGITSKIGKYYANMYDKPSTQTHNRAVIDLIYNKYMDDYRKYTMKQQTDENGNVSGQIRSATVNLNTIKFGYIPFDGNASKDRSINKKDAELVDALYRMLPEDSKNYLKVIFGSITPKIRVDMALELLGDIDKSLLDLDMFKNMPKDTDATRLMTLAKNVEKNLQSLIGLAKQDIVIKNPAVSIGNILSGITNNIAYGQSLPSIISSMKNAIESLAIYDKQVARMNQIRLEMQSGKYTVGRMQEFTRLKRNLESNPLFYLRGKLGLMNTIAEDLDMNDDSIKSQVEQEIDAIKAKLNSNPLTKPLVSILDTLYMSDRVNGEPNKLKMLMTYMALKGDFLFKYSLFEHLTKSNPKMSNEEKVNIINNTFVNYDIPLGSTFTKLDRTGILMFAKFALGIQRAVIHSATNRPVSMLGSTVLGNFLDIQTLSDVSMLSGHGFGMITTPLDMAVEVATPELRNYI